MTKHLRRWLNDRVLREEFDGSFECRIADVLEEPIKNRFTGQRTIEPVIVFETGWRLIPNNAQRLALIELFGSDTEDWKGRRLCVYRQVIERKNKAGEIRIAYEKRVKLPLTSSLRQVT